MLAPAGCLGPDIADFGVEIAEVLFFLGLLRHRDRSEIQY